MAPELLTEGHAPPLVSALVVYGALLAPAALFLAVALFMAALHAVAARLARRAQDSSSLAPGWRRLSGTVELRSGPALRVEISQFGQRGLGKIRWREIDRTLRHSPFDLRLADGQRVEVRPDEGVRFQADLSTENQEDQHRLRVAALAQGDRVVVEGELAEVPSLRSAGRKPLRVCSLPPGLRARQRAGIWMACAAALTAMLGAIHVGVFLPYHTRVLLGSTVRAEVVSKSSFVTRSGGGRSSGPNIVTHWNLKATTAQRPPRPVEDLVEFEGAQQVEPGDQVPVRTAPLVDAFCQFGDQPTAGQAGMLLGGALSLAVFALVAATLRQSRAWWEKAPLLEQGR